MGFFKKRSIGKSLVFVLIIYIILSATASIQSYLLINKSYPQYTQYNNYVIFKQSFFHLKENTNLYTHYYDEHGDLFKYSPTFALLFAPLSYLPDIVGLSLWNLINAFVFFLSIYLLPGIHQKQKLYIYLFCLIEVMTSLQNEQSNALVCGLIILGFAMLEKRHYALATLFIIGTVYIKLFGVVAVSLFLFYPQKWKLALYAVIWAVILFFAPIILIGFDSLTNQYGNWVEMLKEDHNTSNGLSVIGFIDSWFNLSVSKTGIVLAGAFAFCLPLIQWKKYGNYIFRLFVLSSVLIWVIIFNHKAESSTFVIAISGVSIWYFSGSKSTINTVLIIIAFVLTSLSPTDIFPQTIRDNYVIPYALKALPCILIWIKILFDLFLIPAKANIEG